MHSASWSHLKFNDTVEYAPSVIISYGIIIFCGMKAAEIEGPHLRNESLD